VLPGNILRLVESKEQHRAGDIIGSAESAAGDGLLSAYKIHDVSFDAPFRRDSLSSLELILTADETGR
jgi:hypothetical protein